MKKNIRPFVFGQQSFRMVKPIPITPDTLTEKHSIDKNFKYLSFYYNKNECA